MKPFNYLLAALCIAGTTAAVADITVKLDMVGKGMTPTPAGTVTLHETQYGLLLTPDLHGLTPGLHGFHVHVNPSCADGGMAAGGHLDTEKTGKHLGPYNPNGHLGDLPALYVDAQGNATLPVLAPRIHSLNEVTHHSLMVHAGGDNYSDAPEKLGGGGMRMACGIIK